MFTLAQSQRLLPGPAKAFNREVDLALPGGDELAIHCLRFESQLVRELNGLVLGARTGVLSYGLLPLLLWCGLQGTWVQEICLICVPGVHATLSNLLCDRLSHRKLSRSADEHARHRWETSEPRDSRLSLSWCVLRKQILRLEVSCDGAKAAVLRNLSLSNTLKVLVDFVHQHFAELLFILIPLAASN